MNKSEFMSQLQAHLSALPPEEVIELMEDYESHFAFALQSGKTEAEIAAELGDPAEIAKEALGNRFASQDPVYWFNPGSGAQNPPPAMAPGPVPSNLAKRRSYFTTMMVCIGLFFLNLMVIPLLMSLWSVLVSLAASALAGVLSPVLFVLEYVTHGEIHPAKGFSTLVMVGLGILLFILSRYVFKGLLLMSKSYLRWNVRTLKGEV